MAVLGELHWLGIAEGARKIRSGEVSPVEVIEDTLAWIAQTDRVTHAYNVVLGEQAVAAARTAEQELRDGTDRGPLHGIGFAAKDLIAVRDVAMGGNSQIMCGYVPSDDATVVARLRQAGAVCLGKLRTHEFGWGVYTRGGVNPWDGKSIPGGSSGGSGAAVAAGQCAVSLGTDCATSVRTPAALNGIAGLRPTPGRISTTGVVPLSMTMDTVGPLARSVEDIALVLDVLAGHDPADPGSLMAPVPEHAHDLASGVRGLRVGVPTHHFFDRIEEGVERAVRTAIGCLQELGAEVREIALPHAGYADTVTTAIITPEGTAMHDEYLYARAGELGADVRLFLEAGQLMLAKDYCRAQQMRTLIAQDFAQAFCEVDVIAAPAAPATAKPYGDDPLYAYVTFPDGITEELNIAFLRYSTPATLAGCPTLVVPCGRGDDGLPAGVQLMGPALTEPTLLRAGYAYQSITEWHRERPTYLAEFADAVRGDAAPGGMGAAQDERQ